MFYKLTAPDGSPIHGGSGAWGLPRGSRPGRWRREQGPLDLQCGEAAARALLALAQHPTKETP
jgi:hypothetical protein